jgi:hypothetical protein
MERINIGLLYLYVTYSCYIWRRCFYCRGWYCRIRLKINNEWRINKDSETGKYTTGNIIEFAFENHGNFEKFWNIKPCSALKVNWRFGGTCCLALLSRWLLLRFILRPWRWRCRLPPKRRLTCNGPHGIISPKIVLFIITAVRTSNPAWKIWLRTTNNPVWYIPSIITVRIWNGIVHTYPLKLTSLVNKYFSYVIRFSYCDV